MQLYIFLSDEVLLYFIVWVEVIEILKSVCEYLKSNSLWKT
jgi:hypothetical protein